PRGAGPRLRARPAVPPGPAGERRVEEGLPPLVRPRRPARRPPGRVLERPLGSAALLSSGGEVAGGPPTRARGRRMRDQRVRLAAGDRVPYHLPRRPALDLDDVPPELAGGGGGGRVPRQPRVHDGRTGATRRAAPVRQERTRLAGPSRLIGRC